MMKFKLKVLLYVSVGLILTASLSSCEKSVDSLTLIGQKHFVSGYEPLMEDGKIQVVVEIPVGTLDKWEVDKETGHMKWEIRDGKPRVVQYLGYPGNYGMIPRTLLSKESGGDGDPLDVIVLGQPVERGSIVKAQLIGVLRLLDGGEQDDKLIAVLDNSPFSGIHSIEELNQEFIGVAEIIQTWFVNYKGPGELE
ncbi:MAG: inorganic diphosphatase, partial [Bacteroidota bacterium]|nr:inorganic diphosphatase [Bacteroidota bacterium]